MIQRSENPPRLEARTMARPEIRRLLEASLDQLLERCCLVDVRPRAAFREARIRGSMNVPLEELRADPDRARRGARGRDIVVVSGTGRSAQDALELLSGHDFPALDVVEGGIVAWERSGLPVERDVDPTP